MSQTSDRYRRMRQAERVRALVDTQVALLVRCLEEREAMVYAKRVADLTKQAVSMQRAAKRQLRSAVESGVETGVLVKKLAQTTTQQAAAVTQQVTQQGLGEISKIAPLPGASKDNRV